ncbi:MAG: hypothetical protein FWE41_00415 [Coriobacteriia bacterium]|nr:hypothetical protein [Coriobacteriia bacterium]MCL2750297.1 hypothetical protein [Coriobacteriia bacterium]
MKKLFILVLVLVLTLSLVACGGNNNSDNDAPEPQTQIEVDEPEKEEEAPPVSTDVSGDEYPYATPIIPDGLSSSPDSFQVSLNGDLITLPALYSDFAALGWTTDRIDGETLKPGYYTIGSISLKKGDTSLNSIRFINLSDTELPLSECYVYGFAFSYDRKGAVETSVVLPGGLHIGSTIDEIIAAYGEPTETAESGSRKIKLTYNFGNGNLIEFAIDTEQPPLNNEIRIYKRG